MAVLQYKPEHDVETATYEASSGKEFIYLKRRFVPVSERFTLLQERIVAEGDRLDNVIAFYLSDPLQFWYIYDANNAMNLSSLTDETGCYLRITDLLCKKYLTLVPFVIPEVRQVSSLHYNPILKTLSVRA